MVNLEQLEQELALSVRGAVDQYLPVPDEVRLHSIEQDQLFAKDRAGNGWLWGLLLLGITGLASAYLILAPEKEEVETGKPVMEKEAVVDQGQTFRQTFESDAVKDSPVIYHKEVLGNE